ncbi:uncharacterized protein BP5553_08403 [Venustampulla echinocandica]|uniref:Heterokaryon incompatibility domain-containing protein n=1 Tax=Venustampulla echinocandica TaxID=2656787 RepID=A0A370TE44_9HELO|nr:uncharacterized protein BP5553_08403 [Venustampulla echinocandica]RDL32964.1 hypothetical protein BP5553_08403 [Venustampulla echinocandica]
MPPVESLCEYCSKIPPGKSAPGQTDEWTLGSWERVKRSSCAYCRIVVSALQTLWQTEAAPVTGALSNGSEVKLYWFSASGPGGRGAFTIDPAGLQSWICMAAIVRNTPSTIQTHYLKPVIEAEFDVGRLSEWISICSQAHSERCTLKALDFERSFPGLDFLRFIDVRQDSIVELRTVPRYLALSYVWGEVANVRLTTGNRLSLLLPGAIRKIWYKIPQTIRDAIELVRRLDARYLWVDTLCLMQNDPTDLTSGVNVMDQVYERSWVAIIAASGHNANAGLPGIREGSRFVSRATRITGEVSVGLYVPLDRLLKRSVYTSRAWTFQEELLPRRAVYFTEKRVFFRCREDMYTEQLLDQRPRGGEPLYMKDDIWSSMLPGTATMDTPMADFEVMLLYYTPRALTNPNDILRALAGIIRRLSERAKCRFFEGIPTAAFDAFIVFKAHYFVLHRRVGFPSYSWTGWKGGISAEGRNHRAFGNLNKWLEEDTWIIWYKRSATGVPNLVWDSSANETFPLNDSSYDGYRRRRSFQAPAELHISSNRTYPTEALSFELPAIRFHFLQFWTLSVYFKLGTKDLFAAEARILTAKGSEAGMIDLNGIEESTFFDSQTPFEFILLSSAWTDDDHEVGNKLVHSKYFIMLLEWNGPVAERRGLGLIDKTAILDSFSPGPQWKEIILG